MRHTYSAAFCFQSNPYFHTSLSITVPHVSFHQQRVLSHYQSGFHFQVLKKFSPSLAIYFVSLPTSPDNLRIIRMCLKPISDGAAEATASCRKNVAIESNLNVGPARTTVPSHCSRVNAVISCSSSAAERGLKVGCLVWTLRNERSIRIVQFLVPTSAIFFMSQVGHLMSQRNKLTK